VGGPPALYVADKAGTAFAEGTHSITSSLAGIILPPAPVIVYAVDVSLERVLDLTNDVILNALGTTRTELQSPWASRVVSGLNVQTHILAEVAYKSHRFQGILFDSKENPGGFNLVIWSNKVRTPAFVEVFDPPDHLQRAYPRRSEDFAITDSIMTKAHSSSAMLTYPRHQISPSE
jgi:RES domain-containing protein